MTAQRARRARQTRNSTPGAASTGWRSRHGVTATGTPVWRSIFHAASYAVAVRHDVNGNGDTDLTEDGGGMSNDPSINIFNLGKPSYKKTRFSVGGSPKAITINMKYW